MATYKKFSELPTVADFTTIPVMQGGSTAQITKANFNISVSGTLIPDLAKTANTASYILGERVSGIVTSSINANTASYLNATASHATSASYSVSSSNALYSSQAGSASYSATASHVLTQVAQAATASYLNATASYAQTASYLNATASYAQTAVVASTILLNQPTAVQGAMYFDGTSIRIYSGSAWITV